jgi:hypothetical protein
MRFIGFSGRVEERSRGWRVRYRQYRGWSGSVTACNAAAREAYLERSR